MQGWGWERGSPNLGQGKLARGLREGRGLNGEQGSLGASLPPISFSLSEPFFPGLYTSGLLTPHF